MRMLCFGDSNTYGYDPRSYLGGRYDAQNRWTDLLAEKTGWDILNAGENGREIPRRTGEVSSVSLLLQRAQPLDVLLIYLGGNDLLQGASLEEIEHRMETFLSKLSLPQTEILLLGPPPMQLGAWVPTQELVEASKELSVCYAELSKRHDLRFINASAWEIDLAFDGVHFTEKGNRDFAERLAKVLLDEKSP